MEALRQIVALSGAVGLSTREVANRLDPYTILPRVIDAGPITLSNFTIQALPVKHGPILDDYLPKIFAFLIDNQVLNPADSFTADLLTFRGSKY